MGTRTSHRSRTFRTSLAAAAAGIVLVLTGVSISPAAGSEGRGLVAPTDHQVAVCHATGSDDNPYSVVYPNTFQLFSPNGHGWDEDDIIPPFAAGSQGANAWEAFDGHNWDDGEAIWAAGCAVTTDDEVVLPPAPAGSVTVDKELAGSGLPAGTTEFAFSVTCSAGLVPLAELGVAPVDEPREVASGLGVGDTCTISETGAGGAVATAFSVDGGAPVTGPFEVTITEAGQGVAVVVTNTFACPQGQLDDGEGGCGVDACADVPGFQPTGAACAPVLIPPVVIENLPPQAQAAVVGPTTTPRPVQVAGIQVLPTAAAQELPRTGLDTATLVLLGLGLVLAGAGGVVAARRREESTAR